MSVVLIESDWNLKMSEYIRISLIWAMRINRIRLEFKVLWNACTADSFRCINRIRLEFKGQTTRSCPS